MLTDLLPQLRGRKLTDNFILKTDSYKMTHWLYMTPGTEVVNSYLEARLGGKFPYTLVFGPQGILAKLEQVRITQEDVDEAAKFAKIHFMGNEDLFNRKGWEFIVNECDGKLPISIFCAPEGSKIPLGNVLLQMRNTRPEAAWLTQALESYVMHAWYPMTVATLSRNVREVIEDGLIQSGADLGGLDFMLQDFGYRGATGDEAAQIGGAAHLVNFKGTDTMMGMAFAVDYYAAQLEGLGFSVPASEHSLMTAEGEDGEFVILQRMLDKTPTGILSVVADSFNYWRFIDMICTTFKDQIKDRDGVFVARPDSPTPDFPEPALVMLETMNRLGEAYGFTVNAEGMKVLPPQVRVLWGDGINIDGIRDIVTCLLDYEWSIENVACFGMGGGLLQKVNRDTQHFAIKCNAQLRNGIWYDVQKNPLDKSKASKAGILKLISTGPESIDYATVRADDPEWAAFEDQLVEVFRDGEIIKAWTFDEVRERANA